jgi:hypothetical protein
VRLVDHEQADPLDEEWQHPLAELRVVQPLRADEQEVDLVGVQLLANGVPVVAVRRVHGDGADPEPLRGRDLIAHEGEQRADEDGRPRPLAPQQRGGDEIDRALAPAGALHAEHAPALGDQVAHRLELMLSELGLGAGELLQQGERLGLEGGGERGWHGPRI